MLVREYKTARDKVTERLTSIVGNQRGTLLLDLPNMQRSSEGEYWRQHGLYGFEAEAYISHKRIGDEWASCYLYMVGVGHLKDGGFAVAFFFNRKENKVEYYSWAKCVHEFTHKCIGNCLHQYTCSKCGHSYQEDSSD